MTMGERIKELRKENGMTQTALAEALGITKGTVSTWETDTRTPGFETLSKMSDIFQRRIEYIMGKTDDASAPVMDEATMEDLALSQVEDDLTEYALKYARLDQFGREAVEAVIRAEYNRCRSQNELAEAGVFQFSLRVVQPAVLHLLLMHRYRIRPDSIPEIFRT